MKKLAMLIATGAVFTLYGCSQDSTPGGPGTALPESEKPMIGQTDNTFTLDVPMMSTSVKQGEMDTVTIGISRGTNFSQDVSLKFDNVPTGVTIEPASARIPKTEENVELTVHAGANAALGDFVVKVTGSPTEGADAMADLNITIAKGDAEPVANVETDNSTVEVEVTTVDSDAEKAERDAQIKVMRAELDALQVKYENLKERAKEATAEAKAELDKKVAAAKVKLDQVEEELKEAKDAAPDRWEKIKEGFKGAGEELKSMFE